MFFVSVDTRYHQITADQEEMNPTKTYRELKEEMTLLKPLKDTFLEVSFAHLMGGYDACFYSHRFMLQTCILGFKKKAY